MTRRWFRRRNFLIHPAYQLTSALTVIVYILAYSMLLGFLIFFPLEWEFSAAVDFREQLEIAQQVLRLHARVWPSILIIALLVGVHAVLGAHRTAGPLFRLQEMLRGYARGQFGLRMRLRRSDRFRELESSVNELGASLEERWTRLEGRREGVAKAAEALRRHLQGRAAADPQTDRLLAQVRDELEALRREGEARPAA
ncbi:MAG: methyl-accepting chemotaxis protein [candidate division NC10 bacterium]|nr:methyl-accepting chemotaxis protein [candidate division NC10 bacterium]